MRKQSREDKSIWLRIYTYTFEIFIGTNNKIAKYSILIANSSLNRNLFLKSLLRVEAEKLKE